jgi:lipopolysaccharide biosynthesis glycosyltransferase
VLLIDVKKAISSKILTQVFHTAIDNKEFVTYFDQYPLNVVFYDKWHKLNVEWNEMYSSADSLTYFRHFAGQKPLDLSFTANDADLFFAYLKLSPYFVWWWKSVALRCFIAKFHWKLKFYSNKIFNTKFPIETLNI